MMKECLVATYIFAVMSVAVGCNRSGGDGNADVVNSPTASADIWSLKSLPNVEPASNLTRTDVIPHTEGRITPGRNYLYCGTFKLVWNRYGDAAAVGDQAMAEAIDRLDFSEHDLAEDCYLTVEGSREQIAAAMDSKFPGARLVLPDTVTQTDRTAFAYLQRSLPFREYFDRRPHALTFQSEGGKAKVSCFGVEDFEKGNQRASLHRAQITIHDYRNEDDFVIRLNTMSQSDELILAKVSPGKTLGETIQAVQNRVSKGHKETDEGAKLQDGESMVVPIVSVGVMRRYSELIPKNLSAGTAEEWDALQVIRFRLDETGAKLESYAYYDSLGGEAAPRRFIFDRPFLVYLVQKGRDAPYFAAWIENSEVLESFEAERRP